MEAVQRLALAPFTTYVGQRLAPEAYSAQKVPGWSVQEGLKSLSVRRDRVVI